MQSTRAVAPVTAGDLSAGMFATRPILPILGSALNGYYLVRRLALSARINRRVATMEGHRKDFYAHAWSEAAEATGSEIAAASGNFFRITRGTKRIFVNGNLNPLDNHVAVNLADDKAATYRILAEAQIPVPEHVIVPPGDGKAALAFLESRRCPIVVKPAYGTSGGVGVSTNVTARWQLAHAMAWASAFCRQVLIERQIAGETYRLVYLDGELLDCVIRRSPKLTGNGRASVRELVRLENARRIAAGYQRSQTLLSIDQDMKATLALQALRLGAIPENHREFVVKSVVNENIAVDNETGTERLCSAVVDLGRQSLEKLGLRLAGIDVITSDPGLPLHETGGAVVDINAIPGFYYHYFKADGRFPLASHILCGVLNHAV